MTLPAALDAIARELDAVRAEVLREADGLSQAQADWRPSADDWSVARSSTTSRSPRSTPASSPRSSSRRRTARSRPTRPTSPGSRHVPAWPPGPREAPPVVRPEKGHPIGQLLHDMRAARERSRQSLERLADGRSPRVHVAALRVRRDGPRAVVDAPGPSRPGPSPAAPAHQDGRPGSRGRDGRSRRRARRSPAGSGSGARRCTGCGSAGS